MAVASESGEIAEIQVTIYGARDFLAKNEQPQPVYVVFGVGSCMFRTETKLEASPNWNEYQKFKIISRHVPLRITLHKQSLIDNREDHVVGRITKPIQSITPPNVSRPLYARFLSNVTSPDAYLIFECSVTQYRPPARYAAVEWAKQQVPRAADYLRHPDCPSGLRESLCCIKLFGRPNPSVVVEGNWRRSFGADGSFQPSPIIVKSLLSNVSPSQLVDTADENDETNRPTPLFVSCNKRKSLAPGYAENLAEVDIERELERLRAKQRVNFDIPERLGRQVKFLVDFNKTILQNVDENCATKESLSVPMDRRQSLVRQLKERVSQLESVNAALERKVKEREEEISSSEQTIIYHL